MRAAKKKIVVEDTDLLECIQHVETWFWDGDFDHVLGCIKGEEEKWLVERGVMIKEHDFLSGVKNLIVGDMVYRIRKFGAFASKDPREDLFSWWTISPETGVETARASWVDG